MAADPIEAYRKRMMEQGAGLQPTAPALSELGSPGAPATEQADPFAAFRLRQEGASATPPGVVDSTIPAPLETTPVDFKQDPAFARLFSIRQNRKNFAGNPAAGAMAQREDRALIEQLSTTYDVTEAEIAQELTGLVNRGAQQAAADPLVQEQARLDATIADPNLEATRITSPEYEERRRRANEIAKARFGGVARQAAETLEPVQYVQDVAGVIYKEDMSTLNLPVGEKLGRIWNRVQEIDDGAYFDSLNPVKYWGGNTRSAARTYTGEENVRLTARAFKVEDKIPDVAFKVAGIGADVFVDPLVFGSFLRGAGRIAKIGAAAADAGQATRGRRAAGDALIKLGDDTERVLSPAGIGRGVGRVVPQSMKDAIGQRMDGWLEGMLNKTAPKWLAGGKENVRWAQHLSGDGEMPWNRNRDVLSGAPSFGEVAEFGEKDAARLAGRPVSGTARPRGLADSMTRAEYQAEGGVERMNESFKRVYATLGNDRAQEWVKGIGDNMMRLRRLVDDPKLRKYEQADHDALLTGALDVVKDMGVAQLPAARREGVLSRLDESRQVNLTARELYRGRSVVGDTVGSEVRALTANAPDAVSLIERETRQRLTKIAETKGLDVNQYLKDYDDVVDELITADIELGYRNTLYAPIKDTFYEEIARRGGGFEQADEIWQTMATAAMRGEDVDSIGLTADLRVVNPYGRSVEEAQRSRASQQPLSGTVEDLGSVTREDTGEVVEGVAEMREAALKTGDVMNRITAGMGIDLNDWWRDLAQGHFRNSYAAFQSKRGTNHGEKLIKALQGGEVIRAPLLHDGLYKQGLVKAGFERESELITQYVEQIAPQRRGERGLLIRQTSLAQHLRDNGVSKDRTNAAMQTLMREMAPLNMQEMVGGVERTASQIRAKAAQTQTGYGIGAERNRVPYPDPIDIQRLDNPAGLPEDFPQAFVPAGAPADYKGFIDLENQRLGQIQNRLGQIEARATPAPVGEGTKIVESTTPAGVIEEAQALRDEMNKIRLNRETRNNVNMGQAVQQSDEAWKAKVRQAETDASILGQLYDPMTALGEGAEYLKRHMPVKQFLLDAYTVARRGDYIKKYSPGTDTTPETPIPEGYKRMADKPQYGPFAGTVVHRQIANEVENALFADAEGRMSTLGRINSAVSGGYLASPSSVANNFIGGLYVGHLYGSNPADVLQELAGVLKEAKALKGRDKLPDMDDIGHLMGGQSKALGLAQMVDWGKMDLAGISDKQIVQKLTRAYSDALKKPMGQGWAGLDWFQATEDVLKIANYRVALKKFGNDKAKAIEYTRNVLFDYGKLPEATRQLRDHGLMTFPGFPMFMASRTARTILQTPGKIMPYDRAPEAVWNATMEDEEMRYAAVAALEQWQLDAKAVPLFIREGVGGQIISMINLGAYAPTGALDRNNIAAPVTESLGTFGMMRPIIDVASAVWTGEGVPIFSERFGQTVFRPGASTPEKVVQGAGFLAQQYLPAGVRKTINFNPGRVDPNDGLGMQSPWGGIVPSTAKAIQPLVEEGAREVWTGLNLDEMAPGLTELVNRNVFPMDKEMADALRASQESNRKKREKTLFDNAASVFLPGVSVVSLEPKTANVTRKAYGYEVERSQQQDELEIRLMQELKLAAQNRASKPAVMAIVDKIKNLGLESVTLPSGERIALYPETYDIIATANYWAGYEGPK